MRELTFLCKMDRISIFLILYFAICQSAGECYQIISVFKLHFHSVSVLLSFFNITAVFPGWRLVLTNKVKRLARGLTTVHWLDSNSQHLNIKFDCTAHCTSVPLYSVC